MIKKIKIKNYSIKTKIIIKSNYTKNYLNLLSKKMERFFAL